MKRHDADAVSLVFGLIFVGLAAGWALTQANLVDIRDLQFAGPILLIVAGAIGLVVSLRRGRQAPVDEQGEQFPYDESSYGEQSRYVEQSPQAEPVRYGGDTTAVLERPGEAATADRDERSDGPGEDPSRRN